MIELPGWCNLYEQARLSLNYLQGAVDYWQNATPFFWVKWNDRATWLLHNHWDHSENPGRFLYAAVLSRCVLGISDELPVEALFKRQIYASVPAGEALSFRPNPSPYETTADARDVAADHVGHRGEPTLEANLWDNRSVVTGLMLSAAVTGDERAMDAARAMVERVKQLALRENGRAWFTRLSYPPGYDVNTAGDPKVVGQNMGGWISPLVFHHRLTGDVEALELAAGLARALAASYPLRVAEMRELPVRLHTNVHGFLHMIAGLVRVARATSDDVLLAWAKDQYDGVIERLASETGWTQEFLPSQRYDGVESCETCVTADRIDAGIQLALAGHDECFDDVARCVFNYLDQAQFRDNAWMPVDPSRRDDFCTNSVNIRERLIGAYVGWGAPNDLVEPEARVPNSVQNCCGPHGAFAVHQAWHHAVRKTDEGVFVDLLISRDTPWCSVISRHPVGDILSVRMKCDGPLFVRVPASATPETLHATRDGERIDAVVTGRRVRFDLRQGDEIALAIPQHNRTSSEVLNGRTYRFHWKGDFVTDVEPEGAIAPIYQRKLEDVTSPAEPAWPPMITEIEW